ISSAIASIGVAFEGVLNVIANLINFIAANSEIFGPIAVGIGTIVAALTAWHIITKAMTIAQGLFNVVLAANPIGLVIIAITGIVAALAYFLTQTETGRKVFAVAMDAIKTAAT